jgi:hypothetical protein
MLSSTSYQSALALLVVLLLGSCADDSTGGGPAAPARAVTTEQGLTELLSQGGTCILPGSDCQGTTRTTTGNRFEFHSDYSCPSCRKSAIKYYRGGFRRALEKKGWKRTDLPLPQRLELRRGTERLVVEVGTDAEAAVDGKLRTFITHGLY